MINTILRQTRPGAKQLYLDPRTKLLLCLTVTFAMLAGNGVGLMPYVEPILAAVPILFLFFLKKYALAGYYTGIYLLALLLPYYLLPYFPSAIALAFSGFITLITQAMPSMSMMCFLILTTGVSEFIAAMDRLHVPKKISITLSVMFRFFPTIREEYAHISEAMRLRGVGSVRNPLEMLEYRFVPLLTGLVVIGNELSASALTRGLQSPQKRTHLCSMGFHWQDGLAFLCCLIFWVVFIVSVFFL